MKNIGVVKGWWTWSTSSGPCSCINISPLHAKFHCMHNTHLFYITEPFNACMWFPEIAPEYTKRNKKLSIPTSVFSDRVRAFNYIIVLLFYSDILVITVIVMLNICPKVLFVLFFFFISKKNIWSGWRSLFTYKTCATSIILIASTGSAAKPSDEFSM